MAATIQSAHALQELAYRHAREVVDARARDDTGEARNLALLEEFQRARQPFLSDKQYTALYRTYTDLVTTAVTNHYFPGSAVAKAPVRVSDIKDGDEIYRPNALPLNSMQWKAYLLEVEKMVKRFAREIAVLASTGSDTKTRLEEQQFEATRFSLDHGLNEDERRRDIIFYREAFASALERELETRMRDC